MAALGFLLAMVLMVVSLTESAVIVVGGEKGWTTGFNYDSWATSQNLQLRGGDSLVFLNPNQVSHTVSFLDSADAYQKCTLGGGTTVHPIPGGTNYTMTVPASLESRTLYAVCTIAGHCTGGQKMKAAVLPAALNGAAPAPSALAFNPNDADVNRYICWTTAILLIVACFWNSS